jgi:hypothetical protein
LNRKIIILNVVLAAVVIFACFQLRNEWRAARSREAIAMHPKPVKPPLVRPFSPLPAAEAVLSAGYNAIAQKDLFDPSRNPNVEIPAPPPAPAPPPPPPMPALPCYHGQMNLDGVAAILSEAANSPQTSVKPGETIGQFKLVDVSIQEIFFEWNGTLVRRRLDELTAGCGQSSNGRVASAPTQAPPPPPVVKTPTGPGELAPQGYKVCNPADSMPDGAVVDGFRKVSYSTPFGSACRWDPLGK